MIRPSFIAATLLALLAPVTGQAAAPTTFDPMVGGAALCHDHVDPVFFRSYLTTHFGPSVRTDGGAYWHAANGARLFNLDVQELFVNTEDVPWRDFLGALFNEPIENVQQKILEARGVKFVADPQNGNQLRSADGAFLIRLTNGQTKLYCVKFRANLPQ